MKKFPIIKNQNILGIFAHPDDDAFGPSGLLYSLAQNNNVFEIFITSGDAGKSSIKINKPLYKVREKEVLKAGKLMNIKKIYFLRYKDGALSNNLYYEIVNKINLIIKKDKIKVLITYSQNGVSGHIDHIFTSLITTYIAQKNNNLTLYYFCLSKKQRSLIKDYFIYFPDGLDEKNIDYYFDYSSIINEKIKIIKCHHTQKHDINSVLKNLKNFVFKKEYYIKFKKIY